MLRQNLTDRRVLFMFSGMRRCAGVGLLAGVLLAGCGTRASAQQAGLAPTLASAAPITARRPVSDFSSADVSPDEEVVELDDTVMMDLGASRASLTASPTAAGVTRRTLGTPRVGPYANGADDAMLNPVHWPLPSNYPLDAEGRPVLGLDVPIEDLSGHALDSFHAALARAAAGQGQARVAVFGASHVASDTWTATTRRLLQERFGNAGHGFVLPAEPWRSYRHSDVIVQSARRLWHAERFHMGQSVPERFGLAGVALVASDSRAWARLDTGQSVATDLELYFERQPGGGSMALSIDGGPPVTIDTADALTRADYRHIEVSEGRHTLELRPLGNGPVKLYGVSTERRAPGVIVDALGINGSRIASQLYWEPGLFAEHLARRAPDLVVLAYGTNESGDDDVPIADYELRMREIVARVRAVRPTASCLLVGPSDRPIVSRDGIAARPRTLDIIAAQRRVARDYRCGFFDLVAFGGGPLHMQQWSSASPPWAQRDRVHFTSRGYARLGESIARALVADL